MAVDPTDPSDPSAPVVGETSTEIQQVNLNVCTKAQYAGEVPIYGTQFYAITDAPEPIYASDAISMEGPSPWIDGGMLPNEVITAAKVNWTTMKIPTPSTTVITDFGTITSNKALSITKSGFITGRAVTFSSGKHAMICLTASDSGIALGGIPYTEVTVNNQVFFCAPVRAGQTVYARVSGSNAGQLETVKLVGITWG